MAFSTQIPNLSTSYEYETFRDNMTLNTAMKTVTKKCYFGRARWRAPNVKSAKVRGWRPPKPHRASDVSVSTTAGDWWTHQGYLRMRYHIVHHGNCYYTNPPAISSWFMKGLVKVSGGKGYKPKVSVNTKNRAVTQALAKANRNQMEIGVALGESAEAVTMIIRSTTRIMRALRMAKRGQFLELYREFGAQVRVGKGAELWLEYQMGWKPLINDLNDALELFRNGIDKRAIVSASSLVRESLPRPSSGSWAEWTSYSAEESAFVRLDYEVDNSRLQTMKQLGLFNPFSVAWELIPFSFLVDYVVPVGTYIQAMGGTYGLTPIGQSLTLRVETEGSFVPSPPKGSFEGPYHKGRRPVTSWHSKAYERVITFPTRPMLYIVDPFKTATRVGNILALATVLSR